MLGIWLKIPLSTLLLPINFNKDTSFNSFTTLGAVLNH
jgi:hypothetical protein